jgi:multidrug efflux system membrane fusion protein
MPDDLDRPLISDAYCQFDGNPQAARRSDSSDAGQPTVPHLRATHTGRKTRRSLPPSGVLGLILVAAGAGFWGLNKHTAAPDQALSVASELAVTVVLPQQENVVHQTELTGQFSAVNQVTMLAQVSGYLTEVHFQDGQLVEKGDLLFVIDPRPYEAQLQKAEGQYQTAAAALALANKQVSRTAQLNRQQFASDELLDQRTEAQRSATAAIQTTEAAIHAAQLNLEFTRIVAPFSGRMSMRRVSIGSLISGGSAATGPTSLTSIVSVDPIYLDFDMSEADYVAYRRSIALQPADEKTAVEVSLDGEKPWSRTGVLDFIDNQVDRSSGTLHARATLANPDMTIAPGQFARLRVPVSPAQPELLVPDTALVTDQSTKMVMVAQADSTVAPKQVEIGALTNDGMRVVTTGLLPTDRVITDNLMQLRPGLKVVANMAPVHFSSEQ